VQYRKRKPVNAVIHLKPAVSTAPERFKEKMPPGVRIRAQLLGLPAGRKPGKRST